MFADVITTWPRHRVIGLRGIKRFRLMLNADRKNAMQVAVFRDGAVYFGTNKIRVDELSSQIADRLKDRSVERKVYVRADGRARYETVGRVLDQIRSTGIEEVAFLAED
jgi:biopolymer transport protein ExbD